MLPSCNNDYFTSEGDVIIESLSASVADAGIILKAKGQTIDLIGMLLHILSAARFQAVIDDTAATGKFLSTPNFNRAGRYNLDYNGNIVRLEINRDQEDLGDMVEALDLKITAPGGSPFTFSPAATPLKIGDGVIVTATNGGDEFTIQWLSNGVILLTSVS